MRAGRKLERLCGQRSRRAEELALLCGQNSARLLLRTSIYGNNYGGIV